MPEIVNIHEAKTQLSRLLERVRRGESIVIAKAGEPIAELTPLRHVDLVFGGMRGELTYDDEAFDAADEDVRAMFDHDLLPDGHEPVSGEETP